MLDEKNGEEISSTGKFELIDKLGKLFKISHSSSQSGIGEDAAVIDISGKKTITSSTLLLENIHFDLTYFPLKHLGYKSVAVALSDILAMNIIPSQIMVNLAFSNRFPLDVIQELMEGIRLCCKNYKVDLIDLNLTSSKTGLIISVCAFGFTEHDSVVNRGGAKEKELICVSGDFGAAFAGLVILEREKRVFDVNPNMQPDFAGYDYLLERQLKPEPRADIIRELEKASVLPTSMINVSDGIASALIHLCNASGTGCTIYENKIPVDTLTFKTLKDLKIVATTAALNGGEDYELLFTVKQDDYEKIKKIKNISVIGYIHEESAGRNLITNDECLLPLENKGFAEKKEEKKS